MRFLLLLACILSLTWSHSLAYEIGIPMTAQVAGTTSINMPRPALIAGITSWLEDLLGGARKVPMPSQNVRNQSVNAYRYTQREDRRGNEPEFLYYLCMGIWRLAAAGTAAIATAKAFSRQKSKPTDVVVIAALLIPFLIGLFFPLFALFGAFITWIACAEKSTKAN